MRCILAALFCFASVQQMAQASSPVVEHSIEVVLETDTAEILIKDRLQVSGRERYQFHLAAWLEVESLLLDGQEARPLVQGAEYWLALPDSNTHELQFTLRGKVPVRDSQQNSWPAMLSSSGDDGFFLPGYDAWIPRDESGRVSYRLTVTVPSGQRAVATGKLVNEQLTEDANISSFATLNPGEPPSLFIGPYQVTERLGNGLRLRTYFHEELVPLAETYLEAAENYIQRYQQTIGDYPYADFHIISAPIPVGLGFPNLTYVGRQVIPLPFMRTRSLAHEVLHNWWGNAVSVDNASGNWAEGLTTYLADYALAADQGSEAAQSMRIKWLRDFAALPGERDQPVIAFTSKQHQAAQVIGYNKVAFIFHMLTREIGQAAFDNGLRGFWQKHKHDTASWRDLQAAFERAAGQDLDWFFAQWLLRSGAPRLSLGAHSVNQDEAGFRTRVEILQPVTGYRFQLPVSLTTVDGSRRYDITIDDTLTQVEFVTPTKPLYFQADPDSDVFRRLHQNETPPILRDVTLDSQTRTLIVPVDADFVAAARNLASRLMDKKPRFDNLAAAQQPGNSLLLITTNDRLNQDLKLLGLERPSALPKVAYSAEVWTTRRAGGAAVLVVSAANAGDLESLQRPLPHYGGQSYVLFEAGRALSRGIWPIARGALFRDLNP
ncbi:MAG: M1 family peptidase [Gammaproteobacteria bacterium]|nr:M1 family peptidase [Gammaproteobacteria bacterium]